MIDFMILIFYFIQYDIKTRYNLSVLLIELVHVFQLLMAIFWFFLLDLLILKGLHLGLKEYLEVSLLEY